MYIEKFNRLTNLVILFFLWILLLLSSVNTLCWYRPGHIIGYFHFDYGKIKSNPYKNATNIITKTQCKISCFNDPKCQGFMYLSNVKTCLFFNTTNYTHTILGSELGVWYKCNYHKRSKTRCTGEFVGHKNYTVLIKNYSPLDSKVKMKEDCLEDCLNMPLCGFVDYRKKQNTCILYQFWGQVKTQKSSESDYYEWVCSKSYQNSIPRNTTVKKPIQKCTGYYELTSRNFNVTYNSFNTFHTMNYKNCLIECDKFIKCQQVWYSFKKFICLVGITVTKSETLHIHNMLEFTYRCIKNDAENPQKISTESWMETRGIYCHKLIDNTRLYIANYSCHGKLPKFEDFRLCSKRSSIYNKWFIESNCELNQSFWIVPFDKKYSLKIGGVIHTKFVKIYTGLTLYWLAYSTNGNFQKVSFENCRTFDGSLDIKKYNNTRVLKAYPKFYSRQKWYAAPPLNKHSTRIFTTLPDCFYLTFTDTMSCTTLASCSYLLRVFQKNSHQGSNDNSHYNDIQYNFLIDEIGNVYEGYGWHKKTDITYIKSCVPISIALIGSSALKLPSIETLVSMKKLMETGKSHNYIHQNYRIYVRFNFNHNYNFMNIIRFYDRYRGFNAVNCHNELSLYSLVPILAVVLSILVFGIYFKLMFLRCSNCRKCQSIFPRNFNEIKYSDIIPSNSDDSFSISKYRIPFNVFIQDYMIIEKPEFYSNDKRHEIFEKLKFLWLFYQLNINSSWYCQEISILNYLTNNLNHKINSQSPSIHIGLLTFQKGNKKAARFLLCSTADWKLRALRSDIDKWKCICHLHKIVDFDRDFLRQQRLENQFSIQI